MGIWQGAPGISVSLYIWKGIIPTLLGNIIGGGLFVAAFHWYLHVEGQPPIAIDGEHYDLDGRPSRNSIDWRGMNFGRKKQGDIEVGESPEPTVVAGEEGRMPDEKRRE